MAIKKSPLAKVLALTGKTPAEGASREDKQKARKEAKKALAAQVASFADRLEGEDQGAAAARLVLSSNRHLVKLVAAQDRLKKEFGTKDNLVEAILSTQKRAKDADYRKKLQTLSVGRLLTLAPKTSK